MRRTHLLQVLTGVAAASVACALDIKRRRSQNTHGTENRIVLVTGGSRGLGFAIAERFARGGNKLVLTARNVDELTAARNSLLKRGAILTEEDVLLIPADLTDQSQARNLVEHAIGHFGRIDVLVNNAGIIEVGPVEDQPIRAYRDAMETNFFAGLYVIQAALPFMLQRDRRNPAAIVNIGSIGGKVAVPHMLPYTASKFAFVGFSEGLHSELRHKGIIVTTVCPGLMRTGGHTHAKFVGDRRKEERWFNLAATTPIVAASVKHAANSIYRAVAQGRAEITITPQAWLAARAVGVAPEAVQRLASLANEFVLPSPLAAGSTVPQSQQDASVDSGDEPGSVTTAPWAHSSNQSVM
jgi:short-subunit dehydrogenase